MDSLPEDACNVIKLFLDPHSIICVKHSCKHFNFFEQKITKKIDHLVIQHDSVPFVEYFRDLGCEFNRYSTFDALGFRATKILTYLKENDIFTQTNPAFYTNYILGIYCDWYREGKRSNKCPIETMQWLLDNKIQLPRIIVRSACKTNNFELLKWLITKNYHVQGNICNLAANTGNLEMLKWLIKKGYELNQQVLIDAADGGNLDMLIWLEDSFYPDVCEWSEIVSGTAAAAGHFHIIKWLYKKGYNNFPDDICNWVLISKNVEMLDWFCENIDCRIDPDISFHGRNDLSIIKWCIEKDIGVCQKILDSLDDETPKDIMEYLKEKNII